MDENLLRLGTKCITQHRVHRPYMVACSESPASAGSLLASGFGSRALYRLLAVSGCRWEDGIEGLYTDRLSMLSPLLVY